MNSLLSYYFQLPKHLANEAAMLRKGMQSETKLGENNQLERRK